MLILMRRRDENIVITAPSGEKITIQMKRCTPTAGWIGIDAPKAYRILREELISRGWKTSKQ